VNDPVARGGILFCWWNGRPSHEVVFQGNVAKFTQKADLRDLLLGTRDLTLAEASPTDELWGIGLAADDGRAVHRAQWPGKNRLGKALMKVRAALRSGKV
jgi:hypothetical protein